MALVFFDINAEFSVGQSNFCYTFENKPSKIDQKSILFFEDVSNENTIFAQKWCFCSRHPQKNTQNRLKILPRGLQDPPEPSWGRPGSGLEGQVD